MGIVTAVDEAAARVRVRLPAQDDLVSPWLAVLQHGAGKDAARWLPDPDDLVVVILDERGDSGCVLGGIYTDQAKPPITPRGKRYIRFSDGAEITYDRDTHTLDVLLPQGATATLAAPGGITLRGDVQVEGKLQATGDVAAGGNVSDAAGSLAEHRLKFDTHIHPSPAPSPGNTGPPVPT